MLTEWDLGALLASQENGEGKTGEEGLGAARIYANGISTVYQFNSIKVYEYYDPTPPFPIFF